MHLEQWEGDVLARAVALRNDPRFVAEAIAADEENRFPDVAVDLLREAGLLRLPIPQSMGGLKPRNDFLGDLRVLTQVCRELAHTCPATAQIYLNHCHGVRRIVLIGREPLTSRIAADVASGALYSSAISEPGQKSVAIITTRAVREAGGYRVNGEKSFTTGSVGATYLTVSAVADDLAGPGDGYLYLVVRRDDPGVALHNDWDVLGQRATQSVGISLRDVFVPDERVAGWASFDEIDPFGAAIGPLFQLGFAAILQGIAEAALGAGLAYVRRSTRPWPTAGVDRAVDDPYLRWHVGDLTVAVEAAALLLADASEVMLAYGRHELPRAALSVAVAKAKVATSRAALEAGQRILQLCGARAAARSYHLDRFWRNARTLTLHDPLDYKLKEIGGYVLADEEPRIWFFS